MKRITIDWLRDASGPKMIYSSNDRLSLYYIPISDYKYMREEFKENIDGPGIYLLLGESEEGKMAYIGETDKIVQRINNHISNPDRSYIEEMVFIKSENKMHEMSKDQMHYLERALISKFKTSDYIIDNKNDGQGKEIHKNDRLMLDEELEYIEQGINTFGIKIEKEIVKTNTTKVNNIAYRESDVEVYALVRGSNKKIFGVLSTDNSVIVKGGQSFETSCKPSEFSVQNMKAIIKRMENVDGFEFAGDINSYKINIINDITFKSPSAPGILIKGGSNNGWKTWLKVSDDKPIDEFRD